VCGVGLRLGQRLKKSTGGSSKNVLVGVLVTDKAREAHGLVVDHILSRVSFNNTETLSESCLVAACWESQVGFIFAAFRLNDYSWKFLCSL